MDLDGVVRVILDRPGPTRLVAVDGPGGAGKSTFAARLAAAAGGAPVVHTDEFATPSEPVDWWPRLLEQVVEPLLRGEPACYSPFDWTTGAPGEPRKVEPSPIVIIEGVSSGRAAWREHLAFLVWVETPEPVRLARVVRRDGPEARDDWAAGSALEAAHYLQDPTRECADLVVDGDA